MTGRRGNVRVSITGDASGLDRASRQAEGTLGKLRTAAKRVGVGLVAGLAAATAYTAAQTIDFDASMRNVNSIAQVNERQFQKLQKEVLALAGPTAQAPKTLAEGLYDLVSSGFESGEALGILEKSAKAATAGLTTTEVSTASVAAVLNAYKLPASAAGKVSDQLFRTVDRGVVSFDELASTVGDVLPFASSLSIGLDQVGAATATMTKAGISAPETMTRIKNVMVALLKPGDALKEAISGLGFESGEALVKQKGFQGGLEALVGTTDGTKGAVAKLFPEIRALGGVLALTGDNAKGAREDLKGMQKSAGATERALTEQSKSISFAWNQIKAEVSAAAITLGSKAVPAIMDFVQGVRAGTGAGGEFRRVVESMGATLGPLAVGVGQVALTVGQLGFSFAQTKTAMILVGAAAGALIGRMTALGVAWGVSKIAATVSAVSSLASTMGVLRAVYVAQTGVTNASTFAIIKHAAATRLAAGGYTALKTAMASSGIGLLIVLAGTAAGALMGMSAAADASADSTLRLRDANRSLADSMREVREIDIDVAQRKTNLAAANNAVERAERRLTALQKAGRQGTLAYKEAEVALRNTRLEQKRAARSLGDAESDSARKRQDGAQKARKAQRVAREEIQTRQEAISSLERAGAAARGNVEGEQALLREKLALAQAQKSAASATLKLKRIQLDQAQASGASGDRIKQLRDEVKQLEDRSEDGCRRVKTLRDEIDQLKSKRVSVDVDLNLLMPGGAVFSGAGDEKGSGWPLAEAVRSGAQAMADRDPMAFFSAAAGGGLGTGRAAGVDAFGPFASRFGLQQTSGYRPGDDGYHGENRARDYAGPPASMLAFAKFMAAVFGAQLRELIHTPLGFCTPLDTEILTRRGWLRHDQVRVGDETIGYNPETGHSEWTAIREVLHFEEPHQLVEIRSKAYRFRSTPNHRWMTERRTTAGGAPACVEEFATTHELTSEHRIVAAAAASTPNTSPVTPQEAAIIGWLMTDGHVTSLWPTGKVREASIYQKKQPQVDDLRELLADVPHSEYAPNRHGLIQFRLDTAWARSLLERAGIAEGADLDAFVLALDDQARRALVDAMFAAEGTTGKTGQRTFSQVEGPVLEAFVLAAYLCGERPSRHRTKPRPNAQPHQVVTLAKPRIGGVGTGLHQVPAGAEPVWCVRTDLGTWTAQQQGVVTLTGNSIKNGQRVAPYARDDHFDHVHAAMATGGILTGPTVLLAGEEGPRHPEFFISTNPRDRDRSRGLLVQAAAALGAPAFKKGGTWGQLVGSSWDNDELATLAHLVGMSNPGYRAQVAQGESGGDQRAVGKDPEGTEGLGLWQITTGHNDDLIKKYGGREAMFNPLRNAEAAKEILDRQGPGAWYASPTGPRGKVDRDLAAKMRALISGGEIDPDKIPVHGRKRLSYDEKVSKLDRRIARAETTAKMRDDRRAATDKLDLLRTRQSHLEKKARGINKLLKGKLKPPVRERLLSKRESILSELASMPGEASSLVQTLREAGVGPKRLRRLAKGFGIGVADLDAEKPTARDRADLQLARAERTADKGDDVVALEKLVKVSEAELKTAKKTGDPRKIAEATRNLKDAADALRDALPTAQDFASRDLALAELTETLDDDKAALAQLVALAEADLAAALATADPRDDIEAAQALKGHVDALKALDESIQQQTALLEQKKQFEEERLAVDKKLAALAESQGPAMLAALLAWVDGAIGGPVQHRFGLPTTAGVSAGYQ